MKTAYQAKYHCKMFLNVQSDELLNKSVDFNRWAGLCENAREKKWHYQKIIAVSPPKLAASTLRHKYKLPLQTSSPPEHFLSNKLRYIGCSPRCKHTAQMERPTLSDTESDACFAWLAYYVLCNVISLRPCHTCSLTRVFAHPMPFKLFQKHLFWPAVQTILVSEILLRRKIPSLPSGTIYYS
jgi:hypothetical protein